MIQKILLLLLSFVPLKMSAVEADFIANPRQLILEGRRSGEGYFSADGQAMVFQSER